MIDYLVKYSHENQKPITIVYQKGLEISQRRIRVLRIMKGNIQCYCYKKKAVRNFKRDQILSAFMFEEIPVRKMCGMNEICL